MDGGTQVRLPGRWSRQHPQCPRHAGGGDRQRTEPLPIGVRRGAVAADPDLAGPVQWWLPPKRPGCSKPSKEGPASAATPAPPTSTL